MSGSSLTKSIRFGGGALAISDCHLMKQADPNHEERHQTNIGKYSKIFKDKSLLGPNQIDDSVDKARHIPCVELRLCKEYRIKFYASKLQMFIRMIKSS